MKHNVIYAMLVAVLLSVIVLSGCSSTGKINLEVSKTHDAVTYSYTSTKDVDVEIVTPEGQRMIVRSSASAPVTALGDATQKNAESINKLLDRLPIPRM